MIRIILFAAFIAAGLPSPLCHAYSGGTGTETDPYQIASVLDWQTLMASWADWDQYFILTADIDLAGLSVTPVGNSNHPFEGVFDGNNHIIRNVTINMPTSNYVSLFGSIMYGNIKNLGVENVNIHGYEFVGGLAGDIFYNSITSCYATGAVVGFGGIGGLVGSNRGIITSCRAACTVSGYNAIGGLAGIGLGRMTACYAMSSVSGQQYIGGLIGGNVLEVKSCYAMGTVSGDDGVGGLTGWNRGWIDSCYATCAVSGNSNTGGLVGKNEEIVNDSFWDTKTSGQPASAGGTGKTTSQMQTLSTFTTAGWDFANETTNGTEDIWRMCTDRINYPRLAWEYDDHGDFACPDGTSTEDLDYFIRQWLMTNCLAGNNDCIGADMDNSGSVDLADYAIFARHWLEQSIK